MWRWYSNIWYRNIFGLFTLCLIFGFIQYTSLGNKSIREILAEMVPAIALIYALIYVNNVFVIKRFLLTKKYESFLLWFSVYLVIGVFCLSQYAIYVGEFKSLILEIVNTLFFTILGTGTYFIHQWAFQNITLRERKLANTVAELEFLKMQLNPHFLLNAMNNLYGEALTNPTDTPNRILQLSHLFRYQIEASKKEEVHLDLEIDFVNEYLDYYKFTSDSLVVESEYSGNLEAYYVPPLLFFSLVENAVKFSLQTEEPYILIRWKEEGGKIFFEISNSCLLKERQKQGTGLGLSNLRRRLEVSGIQAHFSVEEQKNSYKAKLTLWGLHTPV
ncbi:MULTISPECIES: histidine kinase [unclassified Myroides]|uniref:sensor histidine kinase n=1 Tax=unclassified Myroides TaxID=2642485 RepID=UPI0021044653|nr:MULTISPECIES: histidine kinase [unclassified Myroides]